MSGQESLVDLNEPNDDGKVNVCPICRRNFNTVAGLKQHWTKGHSVDEINAAIAAKTQNIGQSSTETTNNRDISTSTIHLHGTAWSKFQIVCDDINSSSGKCYRQFDILNIPRVTVYTELCSNLLDTKIYRMHRVMYANFVILLWIITHNPSTGQSYFDRFKEDLLINLNEQIPSFSSDSASDETLRNDYATYMSTPGKYGTSVELCAMAELFNFGFYIIRKIRVELLVLRLRVNGKNLKPPNRVIGPFVIHG